MAYRCCGEDVIQSSFQHIVHTHVCQEDHAEITALLGLRDYLRTYPEEAKLYGDFKTQLAAEFTHNNIAYMNGKDALVKDLIKRAMEWIHGIDAQSKRH